MAKKTKGLETYKRGLFAETLAGWYLRLCAYRILANRYKTPVGEIDIIVKRGRTIAFVEVKARATESDGLYAVHPGNAARVRRAAEWWLQNHHPIADKCDLRFDVIAIAPYRWIRHIPNAF